MNLLPAIFVNHGGGPMPLLGDSGHKFLTSYLKRTSRNFPKPEEILIASAHWEESTVTFVGSEDPGLLYDSYGFPPASYDIKYPAKNSSEPVARAQDLLKKAGIPSKKQTTSEHTITVFSFH